MKPFETARAVDFFVKLPETEAFAFHGKIGGLMDDDEQVTMKLIHQTDIAGKIGHCRELLACLHKNMTWTQIPQNH